MAVTSSLSLWVYTFSVSQIVKLVNCDIKSVDKSPLIDCCHVNWLPFCECHLWQRKTFSVTKSFNLWLWKVWTRQNDRNIIHQRPNSEESHFPGRTGSRLCSIARLKINICQFLFCVQGGADIPHHPFSSSIVLWGGGRCGGFKALGSELVMFYTLETCSMLSAAAARRGRPFLRTASTISGQRSSPLIASQKSLLTKTSTTASMASAESSWSIEAWIHIL